MDFKKLLGSQWKDGMSNDDIVKALSEMDSVAGMISKDVFDKTAGELAEAKRNAKEKMTQEEQFEQTKAELEQRVAERDQIIAKMTMEKSLIEGGYDQKTASELAELIGKGDMDGFIKAHTEFMAHVMEQKTAELTESLLKGAPIQPKGEEPKEPDEVAFARQLGKSGSEAYKSIQSVMEHYK